MSAPSPRRQLDARQTVSLACLLEAIAPKAGNVHRGADFDDLEFADFATAAVAIAPAVASAETVGMGQAVWDAVAAMRAVTGRNTSLGTILLLAPLAAVPHAEPLRTGLQRVLKSLTPDDARLVYDAIRLARPGGMGQVEKMDLQGPAPESLLAAMQQAADYDLVARQFVTEFADVFEFALPTLIRWRNESRSLLTAIIQLQLELLARWPDSLIQRKCGPEVARQASQMADGVLASGAPDTVSYHEALADFDFWLRCDGNRRNPGTTADLIGATLYVALRDQSIQPPYR